MRPILFYSILATLSFSVFAAEPYADPYDQSSIVLEADTNDLALKKIVLLAGAPSSKPLGHEYFAGCAMFADLLRQTPGVFPVMVKAGWPKDESIFNGASAVVFYMDGGAKIPFLSDDRWAKVRALEASGAGMIFLHQMIDFPEARRAEALTWLGAMFAGGKGGRGHWEMTFDQFPAHPVTRGLTPFKANDGWLYGLEMAPDVGARFAPVLSAVAPDSSRGSAASKARSGQAEVFGWTFLRANGGRTFAFSGADWHPNWEIESLRRAVVNGILWAAQIEIPESGAPVSLKPGALNRNLDKKAAPKRAGRGGNPNVKFVAPASLPGVALDEIQGEIKGTWIGSTASGPQIVGRNYLHDGGKNKGDCRITFRPSLPEAGKWSITLHAPPNKNRCAKLPVQILVAGDAAQVVEIDQRDATAEGKHALGTYELKKGQSVEIVIDNTATKGIVIVDALQMQRVK